MGQALVLRHTHDMLALVVVQVQVLSMMVAGSGLAFDAVAAAAAAASRTSAGLGRPSGLDDGAAEEAELLPKLLLACRPLEFLAHAVPPKPGMEEEPEKSWEAEPPS